MLIRIDQNSIHFSRTRVKMLLVEFFWSFLFVKLYAYRNFEELSLSKSVR